MNIYQTFKIGFGNDKGVTTITLLQETKKRIELANIKPAQVQPPKIEVKKWKHIELGGLQECIKKKRERKFLQNLLKIDMNCDPQEIVKKCESLENKIAHDLAVIGAVMEESNSDKFIQKTKASGKQAQRYLSKYSKLDCAVENYRKHQEMIKKFMQQNGCDKENATAFLESNNYDESLLF